MKEENKIDKNKKISNKKQVIEHFDVSNFGDDSEGAFKGMTKTYCFLQFGSNITSPTGSITSSFSGSLSVS